MDNPMEFDNNTIKLNSGIDPEWEIKITKVLNGYIMTYLEDASVTEENKLFKTVREVFEDSSDREFISDWGKIDKHDLKDEDFSMYNLLHAIKEHFGHFYTKHGKVNLVIKFEENSNE